MKQVGTYKGYKLFKMSDGSYKASKNVGKVQVYMKGYQYMGQAKKEIDGIGKYNKQLSKKGIQVNL